MDDATTLTISRRFNGPPNTGNGGYVAGCVARDISGAARVSLWHPPPLDKPLSLIREGDVARLWDGDVLVAEAEPATVEDTPPAVAPLEVAEAASRNYPGFVGHPFPTCFVCGPERPGADGLRLFPGPVPDESIAATPWIPGAEFAGPDGAIRPEIVWAALDCPSYFGAMTTKRPAVLGRIAVAIRGPVLAGRPHVVLGWARGDEGRKHQAAAAITTAGGNVVAVSTSTWIELR